MKQSVKCILGIFFIMMFAIASTAFGADAVIPKTGATGAVTGMTPATKFQKLPNTIKITPNDINPMNVPTFEPFKASWKKVIDVVTECNNSIPQVENQMDLLKKKAEECRNKAFTYDEQKAAGCTDNMTVDECKMKLYFKCVKPVYDIAYNHLTNSHGCIKYGLTKLLDTAAQQYGIYYDAIVHSTAKYK